MKDARCFLLPGLLTLWLCFPAASAETATADPDAQYRKTAEDRAAKIVAGLNLADPNTTERVREVIAQQYQDLRTLHARRDALARSTAPATGQDKAAAKTAADKAREEVRPELEKLHASFLASLGKDLTPAQIEQVKDGITYGVVAVTYGVYLKMYPTLKEPEKEQIMAWLQEAREIAMDQGTAEEKHAVFNKYKGKINNCLSRAGYDAKQGAENLKRAGN